MEEYCVFVDLKEGFYGIIGPGVKEGIFKGEELIIRGSKRY